MQKLSLKTNSRTELIDITEKVQSAVSQNGTKSGVCFIYCPHTTAGLTINENADPSVRKDIINTFNKLIPESKAYAHAEGNADSHIKAAVFGSSLTIFVENGALQLGTWQGIYFCEGDGPRAREVWVRVVASS